MKTFFSVISPVVQKLAILISLFIFTLVSILYYTIVNLHERRLDEVVVDLAGRQRMLNQRHMTEILLVSRGLPVDYFSTRNVLSQTLEALTNGGPAVITLGKEETVQLPPAPTEDIKEKLAVQKKLTREFTVKADEFLRLSVGDPAYRSRLEELLTLNARVQDVVNAAVKLLAEHYESKIEAMIRILATIGLFAGILAVLLTRQLLQANRAVENEIAERKQAEDQMRRTQTFLASLVDNIPNMVFVKDYKELRFVHFNKAAEELLGYTRAEMIGKNDYDFFPKEEADFFTRKDREVFSQGQLLDIPEESIQTKYKGSRILHTKKIPIIDDEGNPLYLLGISEDITERKQAEEELRISEKRRVEAFRQSDALKSALLTSVSHELRTPLTAIKTSVSSLLENAARMADELRKEVLEGINQGIDYLNRLVDNLLDMSRIEAGMLAPRCEWFPLEDLVEGTIRRVGVALRGRPLEIHLPEEASSVFADGVEIQQVLVNLLDNAIKYSPSGSRIRIEARSMSQTVEVRVSNCGPCIPPEDLERVFDRFYRVRSRRERMVHGTGLGLAICKGIVEAHGGRIWAESTPGQETTLAFTLPQTESPPPVSLEGLNQSKNRS